MVVGVVGVVGLVGVVGVLLCVCKCKSGCVVL